LGSPNRPDQVAICPAVNGAKGAPSIFDSSQKHAGIAAPIRSAAKLLMRRGEDEDRPERAVLSGLIRDLQEGTR
jgi:hypothetical protein